MAILAKVHFNRNTFKQLHRSWTQTIPAIAIVLRINMTMHHQRGLNRAAAVPLNRSSLSTAENLAAIS